jgi:hypothetical protein
MGKRGIECGIRALKLFQRSVMQFIKAVQKAAQLRCGFLISGLVVERGAADKLGGRTSCQP